MDVLHPLSAGLIRGIHIDSRHQFTESIGSEFFNMNVLVRFLDEFFNILDLLFLYFDFLLDREGFLFQLLLFGIVALAHHVEAVIAQLFDVYRAGRVTFEKVPVDASSKMPDDHMDSIEPYDYKKLKPFSTAYLPGYLADKFDVTVEQSRERADQRCQGTLDAALRSSVRGYDTCIQTGGSSSLQRGKVHYALMPVWMLNTKWHGKDFTFAMNGQTGKLVGDLPMSWGRFWGLFAAIAAPLSILGTIVSVLMLR